MQPINAATLAVKNVVREGLTDIFETPFEIDQLRNGKEFQKVVAAIVANALRGNSLEEIGVHPISHVLLPKTEAFDFRKAALIQPLDTIKYLALVLLAAEQIETHRIGIKKRRVFSYRFAPRGGLLFNTNYTITSFLSHVANRVKTKKSKVFVKCDIANFYDRLNLHRLESVLHSIGVEPRIVKAINSLLIFWSNRDSYGLPVGSNASRVLAEASLIEVDNFLMSKQVDFVRFVDDYRMFAPDATTAHYWLTLLIERLALEGLSINQRKTKIEDTTLTTKAPPHKRKKGKSVRTQKQPGRIMAGYGGLIPTRFREATKTEQKKLVRKRPKVLLKRIRKSEIASAEDIREFFKICLYKKRFVLFAEFPSIVVRFPQFILYLVDLLISSSSEIPAKIKAQLALRFEEVFVSSDYIPEYFAVAMVRLLGHPDYLRKAAVFEFFRSLKRNAGSYVGRITLEALEAGATRGEVQEIRQYFNRADPWEKRMIMRLVELHLPQEEKAAWMRNVRIQMAGDPFGVHIARPYKPKKKRR